MTPTTPIDTIYALCTTGVAITAIVAIAILIYAVLSGTKEQYITQNVKRAIQIDTLHTMETDAYEQTVKILEDVTKAVAALYDAGHWTLPLPITQNGINSNQQAQLWANLRDAIGFSPSTVKTERVDCTKPNPTNPPKGMPS